MSAFKSMQALFKDQLSDRRLTLQTVPIYTYTVSDGNDLLKYADDTYLIIPAVNVETRSAELSHITEWAKLNNLKLNLAKAQ